MNKKIIKKVSSLFILLSIIFSISLSYISNAEGGLDLSHIRANTLRSRIDLFCNYEHAPLPGEAVLADYEDAFKGYGEAAGTGVPLYTVRDVTDEDKVSDAYKQAIFDMAKDEKVYAGGAAMAHSAADWFRGNFGGAGDWAAGLIEAGIGVVSNSIDKEQRLEIDPTESVIDWDTVGVNWDRTSQSKVESNGMGGGTMTEKYKSPSFKLYGAKLGTYDVDSTVSAPSLYDGFIACYGTGYGSAWQNLWWNYCYNGSSIGGTTQTLIDSGTGRPPAVTSGAFVNNQKNINSKTGTHLFEYGLLKGLDTIDMGINSDNSETSNKFYSLVDNIQNINKIYTKTTEINGTKNTFADGLGDEKHGYIKDYTPGSDGTATYGGGGDGSGSGSGTGTGGTPAPKPYWRKPGPGDIGSWALYLRETVPDGYVSSQGSGYAINFKHRWVTGGEYDEPKVAYQASDSGEGYFIAGPFAIDYTCYEMYAGIINMDFYTDASSSPVPKTDWEIYNCENLANNFPASGAKFYIKFKNIPNATKITNIHVDFKYLNLHSEYEMLSAKGKYVFIEIECHIEKTTISNMAAISRRKDENGQEITEGSLADQWDYSQSGSMVMDQNEFLEKNTYADASGNRYKFSGTGRKTKWEVVIDSVREIPYDAQPIAHVTDRQDWYQYAHLDREFGKNIASIQVEKLLVDEENNIVTLADLGLTKEEAPQFQFKVSVPGVTNGEEKTYTVSAESSVDTDPYEFNKYNIVSQGTDRTEVTGSHSETIDYTYPEPYRETRNYTYPDGTVVNTGNNEGILKSKDETEYTKDENGLEHDATKRTRTSGPEFVVEEITNPNYPLYRIEVDGQQCRVEGNKIYGNLPTEGNVITIARNGGKTVPSMTAHVVAYNKVYAYHGFLNIQKIIQDDSEGLASEEPSEALLREIHSKSEELKNTPFNAHVKIIGDYKYLKDGAWVDSSSGLLEYDVEIKANDNPIHKSPEIKWYGEAPSFEVTETDQNMANVEFVSITPQSSTSERMATGKLIGTLRGEVKEGESNEVTVTIINKPQVENGKIKFIKQVDFTEYFNTYFQGLNENELENVRKLLKNELNNHTFKFNLEVENYFGYDSGNSAKRIEINGSTGEWNGNQYIIKYTEPTVFSWVKGGPGLNYKVTELEDDVTDIPTTPSEGNLKDTDIFEEEIKIKEQSIIDKIKKQEEAILDLSKILLDNQDLKEKDYKFKVIVSGGLFNYNGKTYVSDNPDGKVEIQLRSGDVEPLKLVDGQYSTQPEDLITLHIGNNGTGDNNVATNVWVSKTITWCPLLSEDRKPRYTVEEYITGDTEESLIISSNRLNTTVDKNTYLTKVTEEINNINSRKDTPEKRSDDELQLQILGKIKNEIENLPAEQNNNKIYVVANNKNTKTQPHEGKLGIFKTLDISDTGLTDEDVKKIVFEFNITVKGVSNIVRLKYSENSEENSMIKLDDHNYAWVYKMPGKVTWEEGEDAPEYIIEENTDVSKTEIEDMKAIPAGTRNEKTIRGTFVDESNVLTEDSVDDEYKDFVGKEKYFNDVTNLVCVKDKKGTTEKEHRGSLEIQKNVNSTTLVNKNFYFKYKITGKFKVGDPNGEFVNVYEGDATVTGSEKTNVVTVIWYGDEAPKYEVIETDNEFSTPIGGNNFSGVFVAEGTVNLQTAVATNGVTRTYGYLKINKRISKGVATTSSEKYVFKIKIKYANGREVIETATVSPNVTWSRMYKWYASENAPTYEVTEVNIPKGSKLESISNSSGSLTKNGTKTITVTGTNEKEEHKGKFRVTKKIISSKDYDSNKKFRIKILITGNFMMEGTNGTLKSKTIIQELKKDESYTSPELTWWGENRPRVFVSEDLSNADESKGWHLITITNNDTQVLEYKSGSTEPILKINVWNELPKEKILYLTVELGGKVWEDSPIDLRDKGDSQVSINKENGLYDSGEKLIPGVKVLVYKKYKDSRQPELATLYKTSTNSMLDQINDPIVTNENGEWNMPRVKITDTGYYSDYTFEIRFIYDGQTYEPTEFLALSDSSINAIKSNNYKNKDEANRAKVFKAASDNGRSHFKNSSQAIDNTTDRNNFNNRINNIEGYTSIDSAGNTIGRVYGTNGQNTNGEYVYYESKDIGNGNNSRITSELKTLNSDGTPLDLFAMTATTTAGGLTYGFDDKMIIETVENSTTSSGLKTIINARATYEYMRNINLGLKVRKEADLQTQKDLYSAKVIVNDKLSSYKFNKLSNIGNINNNLVYIKDFDGQTGKNYYSLGLYKTDFYYRAEIYKTSLDYDKIKAYYEKIYPNSNKEDVMDERNLELYLTYRLNIFNASEYTMRLNSLNDYYESSLEVVSDDVYKYVETENGKESLERTYNESNGSQYLKGTLNGDILTRVAVAPYLTRTLEDTPDKDGGNRQRVAFNTTNRIIKSSDGITYRKMETSFSNLYLESGTNAYIYVTLKADTNTLKEVLDGEGNSKLLNNQKANIVEVDSYSTYMRDKNNNLVNVGKIDRDSAPDNINLQEHNEVTWYEGDTDEAPTLRIGFIEEQHDRKVTGKVWEDNPNNLNTYGIYEQNEALVGGLTTQLVEKIKIQDDLNQMNFTDYDFVWPTNIRIDSLGGRTIEDVTGFASTIETTRPERNGEGTLIQRAGEYLFNAVPTGNYVVRFMYGNNKMSLADTSKVTGLTTAYNINGNKYSSNDLILTANYDGDENEISGSSMGLLKAKTPAVYNGQDYKATTYQVKTTSNGETIVVDSSSSNDLITNEWHDLTDPVLASVNVNDARDSESRRLKVISNSQTVTNVNGTVMNSANILGASHEELFNDYGMYADTAKLNLFLDNNESDIELGGVENGEVRVTYADRNSINTQVVSREYNIVNIDFGLVERPENATVLDKEISEIKITTSDEKVIFDAKYNVTYSIVPGGTDSVVPDGTAVGSKVILARVGDNYLIGEIHLIEEDSLAIEQLQAIDKKENKTQLSDDNPSLSPYSSTQNFRYINVDEKILQGSTIEIKYELHALNVGEQDYTSEVLANIDTTTVNGQLKYRSSQEIKHELLNLYRDALTDEYNSVGNQEIISENNGYKIGSYLGRYYYRNKLHNDDKIVTTKVRQLIDYVDNDAVFDQIDNNERNSSWRTTSIPELAGNGFAENRLVAEEIIQTFEILDKKGINYISDDKKNIILSIDDQNNLDASTNNTLNNNDFERKLIPYEEAVRLGGSEEIINNNYSSQIGLTISKVVSSEDQANNLAFDNVAEIVIFENSVGRRMTVATPGNVDPKKGEFIEKLGEDDSFTLEMDSSATELITFVPPTGIEEPEVMKTQIIMAATVGLIIMVGGIVFIKKKVLK